MDKLTRYNQKLLAIIGTLIIVAAGLAVLIGVGALVISLIDFNSPGDNGLRIQNPDAAGKDSTAFDRTQEVTFGSPVQLDTAQSKFLLPVGQVNLQTEENVRFESGSGFKYSNGEYDYQSHYGLFNNFIYFNYANGLTTKLFNERIAITHWAFLKKDTIEVLLFKGTTTDDNSDNQMDSDDYQSLFAYFLNDGRVKRYDFNSRTVLDYAPMKKTDLVSISLGNDKDQDFAFEKKSEPLEITTLNIRTREIQPIITEGTKEEIQKIIDGVK